jgi:hypothetical protein
VNHVQWRAELVNESPHGFDVHLSRETEFFAFGDSIYETRAIGWANVQRGEIERGWTSETRRPC